MVAVLTTVGSLVIVGQPAAHAGGTPAAECRSDRQFDVADPTGEPDPGAPVHLTAGHYAQTAAFWPPRSAVLCDTGSGRRQPGPRITESNGLECPPGARELVVPDEIPADYDTPTVARSGAYLPDGWYTLASAEAAEAAEEATDTAAGAGAGAGAAEPAAGSDAARSGTIWTAVCWFRTAPPEAAAAGAVDGALPVPTS